MKNSRMFFTRFGNIASPSLFAPRSHTSWLFAQGGYGSYLVRTAEGEQDDKDGSKDNTQRDQKGIVHRQQESLLLQLFDVQFRRYEQRVLLRHALAHQVRRLLLQLMNVPLSSTLRLRLRGINHHPGDDKCNDVLPCACERCGRGNIFPW